MKKILNAYSNMLDELGGGSLVRLAAVLLTIPVAAGIAIAATAGVTYGLLMLTKLF